MPQQLINVGTVANDGTGDKWRDALIKVNENFTDLFAATAILINSESDFPVQDATTITLEAGFAYIMPGSFSVSKRFVSETGGACSFVAFGFNSTTITFTGIGTMFSGVDASIEIMNISLEPGSVNDLMDYSSSVAVTNSVVMDKVIVGDCASFGTFNNLFVVLMDNCSATTTSGILFTGTIGILSLDRTNFTGPSSMKGVDINSATFTISVNIGRCTFIGPSGAFGISGLANSANISTGLIASVALCEFIGAITPLENITNSDIRWNFSGNAPISDTLVDAMLSLTGNATETVISAQNTPVLVEGTWVIERESLFTGTTLGRVTYTGERDIVLPIDIATTIVSASGTNKDITVYLALNGTIIPNSAKINRVGATDPRNTSVLWQLNMTEGDFLEVFVENNSDAINLIVSDAILRAR